MKQIILIAALAVASIAQVRIKDVAHVQGLEEVQLIGYGLVVGLDGSGDGPRTMFTVHSIVNMLRNLGMIIPNPKIKVKNVAAVMVTATLPPYTKRGAKLDVVVSSVGDAVSLEGGSLLMTPLQDESGEIYAMSQGAMSVGGYSLNKANSFMRKKNHPLSGEITGGAQVKKEMESPALNEGPLRFSLREADFTSAVAMAKAVNAGLGWDAAKPLDAATVEVTVPDSLKSDLIAYISRIEQFEFEPSRVAKVVINEKTGTVVAGSDVTISEVAVSHGSIMVSVTPGESQVSQPAPLSLGTTRVTQAPPKAEVKEEKPEMVVLNKTTNVGDLAKALNTIGVPPRDMIAIFQAIKRAGALNAELVIM